ncbi:MAG TPA: kelch repeat-containing protein [Gemmatimonadales bacterium]|nr:kelch repeat-containing protein [Gemmatimonadales bacterium]
MLLASGKLLVTGGVSAGGLTATAELYDPRTEQFTATAGAMVAARHAHTATRLPDGRVLVHGGFGDGASPPPSEVYDPIGDRFTTLGRPEATVRAQHAALLHPDGTVWIIGGEDFDGVPMSSIVAFDPRTDSFVERAPLLMPRTWARAALLVDGRVLLAGGSTSRSGDAAGTTELLAADGEYREGPRLGAARVRHTLTPVAGTPRLLLVGGIDGRRQLVTSAEVFE